MSVVAWKFFFLIYSYLRKKSIRILEKNIFFISVMQYQLKSLRNLQLYFKGKKSIITECSMKKRRADDKYVNSFLESKN